MQIGEGPKMDMNDSIVHGCTALHIDIWQHTNHYGGPSKLGLG